MNLSWRQRGACRGLSPEIFYPPVEEEADQARAICGQCAVREACLEFALSNREAEGIWGGVTSRERRRMIRQRRKTAAA
ncbi:MAG TPA: WhiB family transcriptional regulator [Acidimicrobiales bacterium]|jgi:WhiB family transcriptional regulator, redox-sensing transcriptional regulator|nr:WhiB family transcriptional regulator [Acidimicrobiales bacterium]